MEAGYQPASKTSKAVCIAAADQAEKQPLVEPLGMWAMRKRANGQGEDAALCREALSFEETLRRLGYRNEGRRRVYVRAALRLLFFLHGRGKPIAEVTLGDFTAFRAQLDHGATLDPATAEVLKGARTFLKVLAREGRIGEEHVPLGISPHTAEGLSEEGRREVAAFRQSLRVSHATATTHAAGAREMLLFVERVAGAKPAELDAFVFERFLADLHSRVERGEMKPSWREALLHGARAFIRHKASRAEIRDERLFVLASPRDFEGVRAAHLAKDPLLAPLFAEAEAYARRRQAKGFAAIDRLALVRFRRFLQREGKGPKDLAQEAWEAFREEVRQDPRAIHAARAYMKDALGSEAAPGCALRAEVNLPLSKSALTARARAESLLASLPPGFVAALRTLEEAMELSLFSPTTRPSYRRGLRGFLLWLQDRGIESLTDVTRQTVTAYRLHLQTRMSTKGTPYAVRTLISSLVALRFFFSWLFKTGQLLADPTVHLPAPRPPENLPRVLKPSEVTLLLDRVPKTVLGLRDRAILELLYGTGLRRSELAGLVLDDLDLEGRTILVREGKGNKDRLVPLGMKAKQALLDYLDLSRPKLVRGDDPRALFLGLGGRRLGGHYLTGRVQVLGDRVGLRVRPHILRHTCATHLLKGRADIRHIQRLLGHKSLKTTERYTRVEVQDLRAVIDRCHPRERKA